MSIANAKVLARTIKHFANPIVTGTEIAKVMIIGYPDGATRAQPTNVGYLPLRLVLTGVRKWQKEKSETLFRNHTLIGRVVSLNPVTCGTMFSNIYMDTINIFNLPL